MNGSRQIGRSMALAAMLLSGCAATKVATSWHEPSPPAGGAGRLMVIALAQQETLRHQLEDAFVLRLAAQGVDAEPSYRTFPDEKQLAPEAVWAALKTSCRQSVLVTHLVDVKNETVYVPPATHLTGPGIRYPVGFPRPSWHGSFGAYYARSYEVVTRPGYSYDSPTYVVETNLYGAPDALLWSALTETRPSGSLDGSIQEFVDVIAGDLARTGLLDPPKGGRAP